IWRRSRPESSRCLSRRGSSPNPGHLTRHRDSSSASPRAVQRGVTRIASGFEVPVERAFALTERSRGAAGQTEHRRRDVERPDRGSVSGRRRRTMKMVVIGGTGLIGTKVVKKLTAQGHEAFPASPNTGVDATTGRGLAEALAGAEVV